MRQVLRCSHRLEAIATRYPTASAEEFINAIEVMTMFEKYYTKEQLDTLAKRREIQQGVDREMGEYIQRALA